MFETLLDHWFRIARSASERQISGAWGSNSGRSESRSRPVSSDAERKFDEKGSFVSQPPNLGRNFEEDERKPLEGGSGPRRTFSDEDIWLSPPSRQDWKPAPFPTWRVSDRQVLYSVSESPNVAPSSSRVRIEGSTSVDINSLISDSDDDQNFTNSRPNACGLRKEVMGVSVTEPVPSSKFAKASALEKVASGMWQSKNPIELLPHLLYSRDNNISGGADLVYESGRYELMTMHGKLMQTGVGLLKMELGAPQRHRQVMRGEGLRWMEKRCSLKLIW